MPIRILPVLLCCGAVFAQETPIAVVTTVVNPGAALKPAGLETTRDAIVGDLLFAGDRVEAQGLTVLVECAKGSATQFTLLRNMTYLASAANLAYAQRDELGACRFPSVSRSTLDRDAAIKSALDSTGSDFVQSVVDSVQQSLGPACGGADPIGLLL